MTLINTKRGLISEKLAKRWYQFWMRRASLSDIGRIAMRLAALSAPPDVECIPLAYINKKNKCGFISPKAQLRHSELHLGQHVFISDHVLIIQIKAKRRERMPGGKVTLGNKVAVYRDCIIETAENAMITIGDKASIHHRTILKAYVGSINIGSGVMIAANCALYSYDHSTDPSKTIREQEIISKGGIEIGNEAWLGTSVVVLDGVKIGAGAIIGAGSVVTKNIPDNAIAVGNPARVVRMR